MAGERTHRWASPSSAERNYLCRGSANLLKRVPPRPSTSYSQEGTDAHEVVEAALKNRIRDAETAHRQYSSVFFKDLNIPGSGFYRAIQIALDYVYSILDDFNDAVMWVEQFVDPPLLSDPGAGGGWCDIAIFVPSLGRLYIIDYKHGAGVVKEVKGNRQASQYGAGFLYEDNAKVDVEQVNTVVLVIVQPRAMHSDGSTREYETTPYELYEYLQELDDVTYSNMQPDAPLNPGQVQCQFCDAAALCPAREAAALSIANTSFHQIRDVRKPSLPKPENLDLERIGLIRFHAPMLRKFLDDVENYAYEKAMEGHEIPGAKLVEAEARRAYYGDEDEIARHVAALADVPLEQVYTRKILPLTHAERLVVDAFRKRASHGKKDKASAEARNAFAYLTLKSSSGKYTLADATDPRPAVNRTENIFRQVQGILPPPIGAK